MVVCRTTGRGLKPRRAANLKPRALGPRLILTRSGCSVRFTDEVPKWGMLWGKRPILARWASGEFDSLILHQTKAIDAGDSASTDPECLPTGASDVPWCLCTCLLIGIGDWPFKPGSMGSSPIRCSMLLSANVGDYPLKVGNASSILVRSSKQWCL